MLKKGRVAVKTAGRDSGVCVVLAKQKDRLLVMGPSVRKRLISPAHLEPLPDKLGAKLSEDAMMKKLKEIEEKWKKSVPDFITMTSLKAKLGR